MTEIFFLFFFLILSGFFSAAEIAFFSFGPEKINALKTKGSKKSEIAKIERLEGLMADHQKLLMTILIGNNIFNIVASALATVIATKFAVTHGFADQQALILGIVTGVMTVLVLVFGEMVPKSLALKYAVSFALSITPLLSAIQFVFTPLIWLLGSIVSHVPGASDAQEQGLSEDELKAALALSEQEGKIHHSEREWVEKILEFGEHTVENVMTPRSKIFALKDDTEVGEALPQIQSEKFSRIPVFHEDLDQITGILSLHGWMEKSTDKNFKKLKVANLPLNKPFKVPITMKIDTLLEAFREEQTHLALVYDEHGGLVGLITMEDVLEEIFGEIQDETDKEMIDLKQVGKSKFLASSEVELEQLEEFINERLEAKAPEFMPWELEDENKTIGLFVLEQTEKFPEEGDKIELKTRDNQFHFIIKKCEEDRIVNVEFLIK